MMKVVSTSEAASVENGQRTDDLREGRHDILRKSKAAGSAGCRKYMPQYSVSGKCTVKLLIVQGNN